MTPGSSWWLVDTWCRGGRRRRASPLGSSTAASWDRSRAVRFVDAADVLRTHSFISSLLTAGRLHDYWTCREPGRPVGGTISSRTEIKSSLKQSRENVTNTEFSRWFSSNTTMTVFNKATARNDQLKDVKLQIDPAELPHHRRFTEERCLNVCYQSCWTQ